jgi:hypothetical protein
LIILMPLTYFIILRWNKMMKSEKDMESKAVKSLYSI